MVRKVLSMSLVLVFILCFTAVNAFAASPQGGNSVNEAGCTLPSGTHLLVVDASSSITALGAIKTSNNLAGNLVAAFDIKLFDASNNPVAPDANTIIRVDISGLTVYDTVKVIHIKSDGSSEIIAAISHTGYTTFKTSSFSVFGFVVEKGQAPTSGTGGGTTAISPQTGVYI